MFMKTKFNIYNKDSTNLRLQVHQLRLAHLKLPCYFFIMNKLSNSTITEEELWKLMKIRRKEIKDNCNF